MEKTVGLGNRMDLHFQNIRIGLFHMDHSLIKANLEKATIMMEEGGKSWNDRLFWSLDQFQTLKSAILIVNLGIYITKVRMKIDQIWSYTETRQC